MKVLLFIFVLIFTLTKCNNFPYCDPFDANPSPILSPAPPGIGKLRLVQVIVRHGARTPVVGTCPASQSVWHCDFTSSEKPSLASGSGLYSKTWINGRNFYRGTCGMGVLTELGYNQQVHNGKYFKSLYNGTLLPDRINKETFESKFYIRSTDVPRVILSAESILSGMYPPEKRDGTFSIKINTMDQFNEDLVANAHVCPRVTYYYNLFHNSELYKNHTNMVTIPLIKKNCCYP